MSELVQKSKSYLAHVCGLSKLTLLSESANKITFKVKQKDFITSFRHMEQHVGPSKAYPVSDTQIDSLWTLAPSQHIIYVTDLSHESPLFFVSLLNAPIYEPSTLASKIEKLNHAYDMLVETDAWDNLGQNSGTSIFEQIRDVEAAAKRLGLIK